MPGLVQLHQVIFVQDLKSAIFPFNENAIVTSDDPDKMLTPDMLSALDNVSSTPDTEPDADEEQNPFNLKTSMDKDLNIDCKKFLSKSMHAIDYL